MRELLFFLIGASIAGSIFLVSLVELVFTVRRRRIEEALSIQMDELKNRYSSTLEQVTTTEEAKVVEAEKAVDAVRGQVADERKNLETAHAEELAKVKEVAEKELSAAKTKAKNLEQKAKLQAEEYLATRQREVEEDLMNLVLDVTKRVLPESLTYEIQRDLVLQALREVKRSND
jgi:flagellar biosynthesis/type III secretory pathway protein FliH